MLGKQTTSTKKSCLQFLYLVTLSCWVSCTNNTSNLPPPSYNPHILNQGRFITSKGEKIAMPTLEELSYIPTTTGIIEGKILSTVPERNNYQVAIKAPYISEKPIISNTAKVISPTFKPIKGKIKVSPWPKWTATEFAYTPNASHPFKYLDMKQGLNDNWGQILMKDSRGRIWISTWSGGISVWDGAGLFHFTTENGLSSNGVSAILEDKEGNIWIGTTVSIDVWDGNTFTYYPNEADNANRVVDMLEDSKGNIWFATYINGVRMWDGQQFLNFTTKEGLVHNRVQSLMEDKDGKIWMGTKGGINIWDGNNFQQLTTKEGLPNPDVTDLIMDDLGKVWIGTVNGISVWNGKGLTQYSSENGLSNNYIWNLTKGKNGEMWIGTFDGLNKWDGKGFTGYQEKEGLTNNIILNLMTDHYGKIWISTQAGGINVWDNAPFQHYSVNQGLTDNDIFCLLQSKDGIIWLGTQAGVLTRYNGTQFTHLQTPNDIQYNFIECLIEDRQKNIWIGSSVYGLSRWDGQQFQHWKLSEGLNYDAIFSLLEDRQGRIWIGSEDGVKIWDGTGFKQISIKNGLANNTVLDILEDEEGQIWMGTQNGLSVWDGKTITNYFETDGLGNSFVVNCLLQDKTGQIWMGTETGLAKWEKEGIRLFTTKEGLNHNCVLSLYEDKKGAIWVGSKNGLNKLSKHKHPLQWNIEKFNQADGLRGQMVRQIVLDQQNQLWLVGDKGIDKIDLNRLKRDTTAPNLFLRELHPFFDKVDWRQTKIAINKGELPTIEEQTLNLAAIAFDSVQAFTNLPIQPTFPYNINHLNFHWSATHANPHKLQYSYFLEGNDQNWSPLVQANEASFQNLRPGNYIFKIRAVSGNGKWSETKAYTFTILPPWWQTNWAYLFYTLGILLSLYGLYSYQRRRWQLQTQLEVEQEKANRLAELDTFKSRFYTNITHEFRTPLTVIKGMSEQIGNTDIKNLIQRNSNRLLTMVNQLLDLSKLESNNLSLEWIQGDVITYLKYLTESFHSFAAGKHLNLAFFSNEATLEMDFDPEKLQQILSNLLSNAIKFTPEYGSVKVMASQVVQNGNRFFKIIVEDTGNGIPKENLSHIFNRFYQVDDSATRKGEGSGIGLALVKELVQLMKGRIEVESELNKGTIFHIYLPIHRNVPKQVVQYAPILENFAVEKNDKLAVTIKGSTEEKPMVLIIEDNADVIEYIFSCLEADYELHKARNGKIGVEKALAIIPDLILCDVMMPEMDGYEVCQTLKSAKATSHIPIILLTAKATQIDKITGLTQGSDAYLTKPFDKTELRIRIKNLIALRQQLKETLIHKKASTKNTQKESEFLKELHQIITKHLDNELFNTAFLCREIAMSRTQLHRKLKALTDTSTANYIRNFRLQKAKSLLETTDIPVGEIASKVGFKDFSHFSKTYHQYFSEKPTETRK